MTIPIEKYIKNIKSSKDREIVILKCQLLVEECINESIKNSVADPKSYLDMDLMFYKSLLLWVAINGKNPLTSNVIEFCKSLNMVRNKMAHKLDYDKNEIYKKLIIDSEKLTGYKLKINRKIQFKNLIIRATLISGGFLIGISEGRRVLINNQ